MKISYKILQHTKVTEIIIYKSICSIKQLLKYLVKVYSERINETVQFIQFNWPALDDRYRLHSLNIYISSYITRAPTICFLMVRRKLWFYDYIYSIGNKLGLNCQLVIEHHYSMSKPAKTPAN